MASKGTRKTVKAAAYVGAEYGAGAAIGGPSVGTVTITHTPETGTRVSPYVFGDGQYDVMSAQRWNRSKVGGFFYLGNTKGYAMDRERVAAAALALRNSGRDVVIVCDNGAAPVKVRTDAAMARIVEVTRVANAQGRVIDDSATDAPVAEVPATAPVAEVPATPVAPVRRATRKPAATPVAPVAVPAEVTDRFADTDKEALLIMVGAGVTGALEAMRARLNGGAPVAQVAPAPVAPVVAPVAVPVARKARRVTAPVAPAAPGVTVIATEFVGTETVIEMTFTVARSTVDVANMGPHAAAKGLRRGLHKAIGSLAGSDGKRPEISVFRKDRCLDLRVTVPANVDRAAIMAAIDATVAGLQGVTVSAPVVAPADASAVAPVAAPVAATTRKPRKVATPVAPAPVATVATPDVAAVLAQVQALLASVNITL